MAVRRSVFCGILLENGGSGSFRVKGLPPVVQRELLRDGVRVQFQGHAVTVLNALIGVPPRGSGNIAVPARDHMYMGVINGLP